MKRYSRSRRSSGRGRKHTRTSSTYTVARGGVRL